MIRADKCEACAHEKVCAYKGEYKEAHAAVKERVNSYSIKDANVDITIGCPYYLCRTVDTCERTEFKPMGKVGQDIY